MAERRLPPIVLRTPALVNVAGAIEAVVEPAEEARERAVALVLERIAGLQDRRASAGVRISATSTDSAIAETMVSENWR